jgi:hypothetical protein
VKILIETIPHEAQRYDTCGDWQKAGDLLVIRVSEMGDFRYEFLVGIHEAIEAVGCMVHGVSEKSVDDFDMSFKGEGEPGDDPNAPYYTQHQFATEIERKVATFLGVDWDVYSKTIELLGE